MTSTQLEVGQKSGGLRRTAGYLHDRQGLHGSAVELGGQSAARGPRGSQGRDLGGGARPRVRDTRSVRTDVLVVEERQAVVIAFDRLSLPESVLKLKYKGYYNRYN